jgi:hypothetical protein
LEANHQVIERKKKTILKWKGICGNYKNPISKSNVGQTSFENKRKIYRAQVVFTTRGGKA